MNSLPVRGQCSQCHDVEALRVKVGVKATAHRSNDDIIVVGQFRKLASSHDLNLKMIYAKEKCRRRYSN